MPEAPLLIEPGYRMMHSGCPFYGYTWPDRQPVLEYVGGNNCGLELDGPKPCMQEMRGGSVSYDACPMTAGLRYQLDSVKRLVVFRHGSEEVTLQDWRPPLARADYAS